MKKLMIAAAIVCAAAMSQAAQITWSGMQAYNLARSGMSEGTIYVFGEGTKLDGTAIVSDLSVTEAAVKAAVLAGSFADWSGYALATAEYTAGAVSSESATLTGKNQGDSVTLFAVLVDNGKAAFIDSDVGTQDGQYKGLYAVADWQMGSLISKTYGNPDPWVAQSVPEPTSGLLLLLGVAGLALRRRRA